MQLIKSIYIYNNNNQNKKYFLRYLQNIKLEQHYLKKISTEVIEPHFKKHRVLTSLHSTQVVLKLWNKRIIVHKIPLS